MKRTPRNSNGDKIADIVAQIVSQKTGGNEKKIRDGTSDLDHRRVCASIFDQLNFPKVQIEELLGMSPNLARSDLKAITQSPELVKMVSDLMPAILTEIAAQNLAGGETGHNDSPDTPTTQRSGKRTGKTTQGKGGKKAILALLGDRTARTIEEFLPMHPNFIVLYLAQGEELDNFASILNMDETRTNAAIGQVHRRIKSDVEFAERIEELKKVFADPK